MTTALFLLGTIAVIAAVMLMAHWIDATPAQKAFRAWKRAHRNAQRRIVVPEHGRGEQIVGEWVKP